MVNMEKLEPRIAAEIAEHVKNEVLTAVPARIDQLSSENVEVLHDKLHVLHYYCLQKGIDSDITNRLEAALETSRGFWDLLEDNANTLADLSETYKMRLLDLGSGVLTELEEIISGEESFRDIMVNSIAILLAWKSDTVWVDMAKEDIRLVPKAHMVRLRDELWQFISESSQNGDELTLAKASEIGSKMNLLLQSVSSNDMPVVMRVMLLSQIYIMLLRLGISRILMTLETDSEET
jgi:hypothetical protein